MSKAVADHPAVERRFTRIGTVSSAGNATGGTTGAHLGQLSVRINAPEEERAEIETELIEIIRRANPEPNATLQQGRPALVSFAPPIELLVLSESPGVAADHARRLLPDLRAIEGLVDVVPDDLDGRPEVRIHFDRERLGRLGVTVDGLVARDRRVLAFSRALGVPLLYLLAGGYGPSAARAQAESVAAMLTD